VELDGHDGDAVGAGALDDGIGELAAGEETGRLTILGQNIGFGESRR
jgi:hypothetical protein